MGWKDKIDAFFSDAWEFVAPLIRLFMSSAGQVLGQLALQAVMEIGKDPGMVGAGGLAKRQAAFDRIAQKAKEQGLVVAESMINAAIETAVQKAKSDGVKIEET